MTDQLPINHVRVGDRHRKDFGDVDALASSIRELGLLAPIVVTDDNALVAGHRRLEACRRLGWPSVPVRRVRQIKDAVTALKAERDENTCRKDFTPSEAVALGLALEELEQPRAQERRANLSGRNPDGTPKVSEVANGHDRSGKTRDLVAPAVGLAPRTYTRARSVVLAQDDEDPKVAAAAKEAVAEMDATGNVAAAERKVKAARGTLTTNDRISAAKESNPATASRKSRAEIEAKIATAKRMASEGYTSRQISEAIGIDGIGVWCRKHDIEVPADAVVGKARHLDSNRIVSESVISLEAAVMALGLVEMGDLDPQQVEGWASSFTESLSKLRSFVNQMKEKTRG